ncbi:hypothetical protein [Leisingera sp. JC11]|uniref:hypothetical protein n=1 Tax=Leisingera sp. JC11 TaxID=3042469 RepID=UPI0034562F6F
MIAHYRQLLHYYRGLVALVFVILVGGTAAISTFFLYVSPAYVASVKVSLLPTQTELAFSQNFVRSTTINPANLLTQTHIEYLLSREIAAKTVDRMAAEIPADPPPVRSADAEPRAGAEPQLARLKHQIGERFTDFRRSARRIYNILNSGRHVQLDPYTDAVLTLQDSIDVDMVEGTYILKIKVYWNKPELAAAAANFVADEYVAYARAQADTASRRMEEVLSREIAKGNGNFSELENQIKALRLARANNFAALRVIDPAIVPLYPAFPRVIVNTIFAIIGWVMASAFLVICADTFSGTVKTDADLRRQFGPRALGTIALHRPKRAKLAELAKKMNMQCNAIPWQGAVTAVGSDKESRRLTAVIEVALRRLKGRQMQKEQHLERVAGLVGDQGGTAAVRAVPGGPRETVVQLGRLLDGRAEAVPATGVKVTDLGGANDSFCMGNARGLNWVVIGIRPGTVAEEALQGLTARLQGQGVENIFGVFLKG